MKEPDTKTENMIKMLVAGEKHREQEDNEQQDSANHNKKGNKFRKSLPASSKSLNRDE